MSSSSRKNETIQKWMQQVITHPGGVAEGIADPDACALIDCSIERVDEVILPSRQCSSCLLYTSPSPRDLSTSRMPSSA